ncbi:sugar 3,4-ketoisomerase [Agrobacterium cavarae]|uniref:sugar 3,4-ketoisomerase n=1 Tax=Agrobacterium cavarae TaxID=2528239 RepID=UPI003FD4BA5D
MAIADCMFLELPRFVDRRGDLVVVEGDSHVPFDIERVYYLCDIPQGAVRGGHGHKQLRQLLIAVSGSFDAILDDGFERKRVTLSSPSRGLLICPMIWRELENFSLGSVCLVLASMKFDENDYYRDYNEFCAAAREASL